MPWDIKDLPLMPYVMSPPSDAILMGHERQHDKVSGLEVAFRGFVRKDAAAATEVSIFKVGRGAL